MSRTLPGLSVFAVGLCIATGGPLVSQERKPDPHTSKEGKYRVDFPEKPSTSRKDLSTGGRIVKVVTEKADGPKGTTLAVTYTDYPNSFQDVPAKTILDGVRDGMKGTDGKVTADEELEQKDDHRGGRYVRVEAGRNAIRARAFLVGTRLYQVMVTGPKDAIGEKDSVDGKNANDFLTSFKWYK